jgi:hypothetical protein
VKLPGYGLEARMENQEVATVSYTRNWSNWILFELYGAFRRTLGGSIAWLSYSKVYLRNWGSAFMSEYLDKSIAERSPKSVALRSTMYVLKILCNLYETIYLWSAARCLLLLSCIKVLYFHVMTKGYH